MYNLYTYEKKILENSKRQSDSYLNEEINKKRKEKNQKLITNYNNRMKNFIFSMCEKPIKLNNSNQEENNIYIRNFKFGEFLTDKQRLKKLEEYKNILNTYEQKRKSIEKKRNIKKIKNHTNYVIIQPNMRFNNRTKLEKIIDILKKDEIIDIEALNTTLIGHIKKLKFTDVKKTKEFYRLLDKNDLEDIDIQKAINNINEIEQSELNNRYSIKDYLQWKYNDTILCFKKQSKKGNDNKNIIKDIRNNSSENLIKNDYKILQKDNFKTYFKGASQYIESLNLEERNEKLKKYILSKKRAMSALKLKSKNTTEFNNFKGIKDTPSPRNKKSKKNKKIVRPFSVINSNYHKTKTDNLLINKSDKNDFNLKNLNEGFRKKKLIMSESMSNEITKSISNEYMQKYNSMDLNAISSIVKLPKNIIIRKFQDFSELKNNEEFKEKFNLLSDEIEREKRKKNNEKYFKFVKRFSRSIFGFKMKDKLDEIKAENKQDYIKIDNIIYPKKDIKTIANKIFLKCNYYKTKKTKI